jgi:hypothetical protein
MSSDITTIKISTNTRSLIIINIYNNNTHNLTINTLAKEWEMNERTWQNPSPTEIIILGNFNCHHSTWESSANSHLTSPDRLLNPLFDLVVNMHLEMALPRHTPTLEARNTGNWT